MLEIDKKRRILIVSSLPPHASANLGQDVMLSLKETGYDVDFLTRFEQGSPEIMFIEKETKKYKSRQASKYSFLHKLKRFIKKLHIKSDKTKNKFVIIHSDETHPPVNPSLIIDKINKPYNFVIVLFWQGMLTANSLEQIYDKVKVPLFVLAMDMFPFTGGCFYFWDCRNFIHTCCGNCPGLNSNDENDPTRKNFLYKQKVYHHIQCIFLGNSWIKSFVDQTPVTAGKPVREIILVINESIFKVRNKQSVRTEFKLNSHEFIIFAGAPNLEEERKGFTYLVQAIKLFSQTLSAEERSKVVLLLAGNTTGIMQPFFDIEVREVGFLEYENLAKVYSMADVYVSPSIEDAGPSMVNQSIMSGTPVVAFNVGVAQDIVLTGETGYRAGLMNAEDFAKGIQYIYKLTEEDRLIMQHKCRELGLKSFSYAAFAGKIKQYDQEFCK